MAVEVYPSLSQMHFLLANDYSQEPATSARTAPRMPLFLTQRPQSTVRLQPPRYADGEIVREGVVGDHGDGAFSVGRGGAANIGSPGMPAQNRKDDIAVPDVALRPSMEGQDFHTGRGGGGNVHHADTPAAPKHPIGLADKIKNKMFKKKVAKEEATT